MITKIPRGWAGARHGRQKAEPLLADAKMAAASCLNTQCLAAEEKKGSLNP